jgi:hypothetical protein
MQKTIQIIKSTYAVLPEPIVLLTFAPAFINNSTFLLNKEKK